MDDLSGLHVNYRSRAISKFLSKIESSDSSMDSRVDSFVYGLMFFLLGAVLVYFLAARPVMVAWAADSWPTVPAVVTQSQVTSHRTSDNSNSTHCFEISYRYEYQGDSYTGDLFDAYIKSSSISSNRAYRLKKEYPEGARISVFVNPDNPSFAVVTTEIRMFYFCLGLLFGGFCIVGVFLMRLALCGTDERLHRAYPRPWSRRVATRIQSRLRLRELRKRMRSEYGS